MARMDDEMPWFAELSAEDRSWVGVIVQAGIKSFVDWYADEARHPELDGTGLGLKYGVGGGLRVASGQTFVLRVDVAWSPDANPISGYLLAGHIF